MNLPLPFIHFHSLRHIATSWSNRKREAQRVPETLAHPREMAELAKQIIRQQWSKRHDENPTTRTQAISLIKTHIVMLRQWRHEKAS
ncbi:MAG: hypothetical protein CMO55_06270 [Verrucomicrobiales bacterium]|nr:hypothetical protein [Verrucomicrobiales bacterium]